MSGAPLHANVRFWRDDRLPGVEARSSTYTTRAFRTHTHRACIISLVEAGGTRFSLSGRSHTAGPGQMVVIGAEAPHACNPHPGSGISYRLVSLAPGWLTGAAGGRPPRFPSPVLTDPELFAAWGQLHQSFVLGAPAGEKQALLLACLRELVARHAEPSDEDAGLPGQHPAIDAVRRHIQANPGSFEPLEELARRAGLSRHHFLRVFKAATGLPPHAFQLQQAIEHAKTLLTGGMAISQAALDAGFADQSHFSRLFREFTGATPGQYLAQPPAQPAAAPTAPSAAQGPPQGSEQAPIQAILPASAPA